MRPLPLPTLPPPTHPLVQEELLPTPTRSHYTFNMRDLSKVFQGMLMVTPSSCGSVHTLQRLWVHECCRVFHDRWAWVDAWWLLWSTHIAWWGPPSRAVREVYMHKHTCAHQHRTRAHTSIRLPTHTHTRIRLPRNPPHPPRLINTEDKDYFKTMLSSLMGQFGLQDAGGHEELFVKR